MCYNKVHRYDEKMKNTAGCLGSHNRLEAAAITAQDSKIIVWSEPWRSDAKDIVIGEVAVNFEPNAVQKQREAMGTVNLLFVIGEMVAKIG